MIAGNEVADTYARGVPGAGGPDWGSRSYVWDKHSSERVWEQWRNCRDGRLIE